MQDGAHPKLLWLRVDPAFEVLRRELPKLLGQAFDTY